MSSSCTSSCPPLSHFLSFTETPAHTPTTPTPHPPQEHNVAEQRLVLERGAVGAVARALQPGKHDVRRRKCWLWRSTNKNSTRCAACPSPVKPHTAPSHYQSHVPTRPGASSLAHLPARLDRLLDGAADARHRAHRGALKLACLQQAVEHAVDKGGVAVDLRAAGGWVGEAAVTARYRPALKPAPAAPSALPRPAPAPHRPCPTPLPIPAP